MKKERENLLKEFGEIKTKINEQTNYEYVDELQELYRLFCNEIYENDYHERGMNTYKETHEKFVQKYLDKVKTGEI